MQTVLRSNSREVIIGAALPFVMIGERLNPSGRKKLGSDMAAGNYSLVRKDAIAQVQAGAHVVDVNAGYPLGDEVKMLTEAVKVVQEVTDVPVCIDSSVVEALESALSVYQGIALVNSTTGEEDRLEQILPLVKKYDAAVIGMANDETLISNEPRDRLAVAKKIVQRAQDHGVPPEKVIIDPLCMPIAADPQAARITFETMRLIRDELGVNMCCGASNISFGLPDRAPLNASFLAMAMAHGLTCAIMDVMKPAIRSTVLAGDVLLGSDEYAGKWISHFRQKPKASGDMVTPQGS